MVERGTLIDGRYEVLARIGSGGMADVYLTQDRLLSRQVAVKLLHRRFAEDEEFVERFRREASSAAGLSHPNVVGIFDRGEWDGTYYIVMEYLPGRTLKSVVREEGALDPTQASEIAIQILRAVRFAHRRGIIHRDIKPQNVILDEEGRAKVADFGIARAGASDMTMTGSIMGTAQYLSPEQAQGWAVSEASDLYAVGIVLYELLTGRVPFEGETAVTVALKQISAPPPRPSAVNPAVGPALDEVVLRALAKDPAERFGGAEEFIAALEAAERETALALANGAPTSTQPPSGGTLLLPSAVEEEGTGIEHEERNRRLWWAAAAAVLLAAAAAALLLVLLPRTGGVRVPGVTGEPQALAVTALRSAGLTPVLSGAPSATVSSGTVIAQSPRQGSAVSRGAQVTVIVSSGLGSGALPNVVSLPQAAAVRRLQAGGFKPTVQTQASATVSSGTVISTDPTAGTELQGGSPVTVVVSSGPPRAVVPGLTGKTQAEASAALAAAGLKVGSISYRSANGQAPGTVLSQTPAAGEQALSGGEVALVLAQASSEAAVPGVVGEGETQAAAALARAGFNPRSVSRETGDAKKVGVVLAQRPSAGSRARRGTTVTIAVGTLRQTTTTTSTTTTPTTSTTTTAPSTTTTTPAPPSPSKP